MEKYHGNTIKYWKRNAEENYSTTPISVLKYITVLEEQAEQLHKVNVSGSLPIEEVALHAADDWYDTAKFRSDVKADLKSYYEGYRDAMRFCQGNDR